MNDHMLLCVAHVKDYIKEIAPVVRPGWIPTQVSEAAVTMLNEKLKYLIRQSLKGHPTKGKTFTQIL